MTNQKASGRCWIFACLNVMRIQLMKTLKIAELELSQNYLFYYDKVRSFILRCFSISIHRFRSNVVIIFLSQ